MTDKVHQLVKSLTKTEQRYFHRYAHQHRQSSPNYWVVYQAINQMDSWDNTVFKEALWNTSFCNHLSVVKTQLYDRLLDALHLYHRENELEEQIKRSLHQAYLLHRRGLQQPARQQLQKTGKLIQQHQLWIFWPEYMELQRIIVEQVSNKRQQAAPSTQWIADYKAGLEQLSATLPISAFRTKLIQLHLKKVRPEPEHLDQMQAILPTLTTNNNPATQADHHQSQALLAFMKRDAQAASRANTTLLNILEQLPPTLRTVPERYLSTLYNHLIDQLQLGDTKAFRYGLSKLRQLPGRKGFRQVLGIEAKIFEWSFQLEFNHLVQNQEYGSAMSRLPALAEGIKEHQNRLSPQAHASLRHLAGLVAFQSGQAALALDFVTPLYQEGKPALAHEIYHYSGLLYILCHFELDNYQLLDHLITNFQRQIRVHKKRRKDSWETVQYLRQLQQVVDRKAKQAIWQEWLASLPKPGSPILIYLDLEHWIRTKI